MSKQNNIFFGIKEKWANLSPFCKIFVCTISVILFLRYSKCILEYTSEIFWNAVSAAGTVAAFFCMFITYRKDQEKYKNEARNSKMVVLYDNMFRYLELMNSRACRDTTKDNISFLHQRIVNYFSDSTATCEHYFDDDTLKKLHACCSWRRVMSSWFIFANETFKGSDVLTAKDCRDVKVNFWHLMTREERIVAFFQIFLSYKTHLSDFHEVEELFKGSHLIHRIVTLKDDRDANNAQEKTKARELAVEKNKKYQILKEKLQSYRESS